MCDAIIGISAIIKGDTSPEVQIIKYCNDLNYLVNIKIFLTLFVNIFVT